MTKEQAREVLTLYRPGTADREEPEFQEALALAQRDTELKRWLEDHNARYEALRAKFRQLTVPEGLKEQILSERSVRLNPWRRPQRVVTAVAALALAIVLGFLLLWPQTHGEADNLASLQSKIRRKVLKEYFKMDLETSNGAQIRTFLGQNKGHGDYVLPASLAKASPTGCAVFPWHGKEVSMVCFSSGAKSTGSSPDLFLFVVDREAVVDAPADTDVEVKPDRELSSAAWSKGNKTYVLAASGNEKFLREHLGD